MPLTQEKNQWTETDCQTSWMAELVEDIKTATIKYPICPRRHKKAWAWRDQKYKINTKKSTLNFWDDPHNVWDETYTGQD